LVSPRETDKKKYPVPSAPLVSSTHWEKGGSSILGGPPHPHLRKLNKRRGGSTNWSEISE